MKIDNNVPHFICEGAPVTRLGDAQLRNSDFLELRNGCPLNIGITEIIYCCNRMPDGSNDYKGVLVYEDTNCRWHCNQLDYHVRGNPVEGYDPTPLNLHNLLSYLGQGWNYINGGKQIIGYLRRNVLDEEISDDED